ncbi:MAG: 4-hydroxybenzoate octaprenyltransferase [Burkholderiaceae bacterium]|nr:4-hydroxybenzoate octaprenyltransferase [Burkholderiaceae bacterium]
MTTKFNLYLQLIRWDKPIGTLLLLWPTLWALWIAAEGLPSWRTLFIFVMGTFLMRSAGCAVNDFADRKFDKHVTRTKNRVLTSGKISPKEALIVAMVCAAMAFGLVLFLNALTIRLSFLAVVIAALYPLFKRFFAIPQLVLGVAFSFGIPMAFAAVVGEVPPLAWMIFAANLCWVLAYDTAYAMVDKQDDLKLGLKTSAIAFGGKAALMVVIFHALFLFLMAGVLMWIKAGAAGWLGLLLAVGLCTVQVPWLYSGQSVQYFRAFLFNNWVGMAVFLGLAVDAWL